MGCARTPEFFMTQSPSCSQNGDFVASRLSPVDESVKVTREAEPGSKYRTGVRRSKYGDIRAFTKSELINRG